LVVEKKLSTLAFEALIVLGFQEWVWSQSMLSKCVSNCCQISIMKIW